MTLSLATKKALKAKAHHLEPVILIGQKGLTPALFQELDIALEHHELLKVKIQQGDKEQCESFATEIAETSGAEFVAKIGRVLVFYRQKKAEKKGKK